MRKLALIAATAVSVMMPIVAASTAQADDWGVRFSYGSQADWRRDHGDRDRGDEGILSRRQIRHLVRQAHTDISSIELRGRTYVVHARNFDGRPVVMALDACSGSLIEIHYTDGGDWRDRQEAWNDGDRDGNRPPPPPPPRYGNDW